MSYKYAQNIVMNDRWAIWIDIEGFKRIYEHIRDDERSIKDYGRIPERQNFALDALNELMTSIYKIGSHCYPGDSNMNDGGRLFAHQFGDGFIICSNSAEPDASRVISIAVAIMRHMIIKGYATKAAISTGDMIDIKGFYPDFVRDAENGCVNLGNGIMTVMPVMGTALIKAYKLSDKQKGAVLILDANLIKPGLPQGIELRNEDYCCVNWISSDLPLSIQIAQKSGLEMASPERLNELLEIYFKEGPCPPPNDWVESTRKNVQYKHGRTQ